MSNGGRRAELDGVRGIAILLVLVGHAVPALAPLAAAGVALFFTLSGYLITGLLLAERGRSGRLDLRRFYARRFTRLAPPLFVMLAVMGGLTRMGWRELLPAATWVTNYASYLGVGVGPLGHTWSLAVEEQFYLVWPVAFLALMRSGDRAVRVLFWVMLGLLGWRFLLTMEGHLNYAYSALETAGVSMLAGCLVAMSGWRLSSRCAAPALLGTIAIAVAAAMVEPTLWLVTPALVLPSGAALVAAVEGARWLAWRPLALLGVASYSVYLWHVPVAHAFPIQSGAAKIAVGATVGLVAYLAVERPVMRWRTSGLARSSRVASPRPAPMTVAARS